MRGRAMEFKLPDRECHVRQLGTGEMPCNLGTQPSSRRGVPVSDGFFPSGVKMCLVNIKYVLWHT